MQVCCSLVHGAWDSPENDNPTHTVLYALLHLGLPSAGVRTEGHVEKSAWVGSGDMAAYHMWDVGTALSLSVPK